MQSVTRLSATQVAYLTSCGGCHGIEGISAPGAVPTLRGLTGSFLCTPAGQGVHHSAAGRGASTLSDRELTDVMNFVAFDIGAPVAGGQHRAALHGRRGGAAATATADQYRMTAYRNQVVAGLAVKCQVPGGAACVCCANSKFPLIDSWRPLMRSELSVNGESVIPVEVPTDMPLLWVLRDELGLPARSSAAVWDCAAPAQSMWKDSRSAPA